MRLVVCEGRPGDLGGEREVGRAVEPVQVRALRVLLALEQEGVPQPQPLHRVAEHLPRREQRGVKGEA